MKTNLKHSMSCLPDCEIDAEIDADRCLVTLRLDHFDSQLVATFVTRVLPEQGVVAFRDDSAVERVGQFTPPAPYQLAVFIGDSEHAAHVVRLAGGQVTVWLENSFESHKRRLKAAAALALQLLHQAGWQAIAIGDVASGTVTWDSLAEVRFDDRQRKMSKEAFEKLWDRLQAETRNAVFVEPASSYEEGTFEQMLKGPHLAWDPASGSVVAHNQPAFGSQAAYVAAWKRVQKAVGELFDVQGSSLASLITTCFDHRGSIPAEWRAKMADHVNEEVFDLIEHEVRRERQAAGAAQPAPVSEDPEPRRGTVSRLNQKAGFGYVDDDDGVHCYIFVFGHAIKHSAARQLRVGARVSFGLEGQGRVRELQPL